MDTKNKKLDKNDYRQNKVRYLSRVNVLEESRAEETKLYKAMQNELKWQEDSFIYQDYDKYIAKNTPKEKVYLTSGE